MSSRDTVLKEKILNSSEKRMRIGQEPGPIKSTAEIRRGTKKKPGEKKDINTEKK